MRNPNDVLHSQEVAPTQLNDLDLNEITVTYKVTKLGKKHPTCLWIQLQAIPDWLEEIMTFKVYSSHTIQDRLLTKDSTLVMNLKNPRPFKNLQVTWNNTFFTRFFNLPEL